MHTDALWQAVLGEIELSISRGSFMTWFKNTQLLSCNDEMAVVGVPNVFIKSQLENKFNTMIAEIMAKNGAKPSRIEYKTHAGLAPEQSKDDGSRKLTGGSDSSEPKPSFKSAIANITHTYRQGLNERYNFESFVVGASNEIAYSACQAIVAQPGTKYNPVFLYGGVGIGKTHLIQAVGNEIASANPKNKVVYASTEQFVQEFVDSLRIKKNTNDFASYYRNADVLIVDDVQFLAGKEKVQEEFFHTFNALYQANKQIIMSSDKPPKDIPTLEDRLKSRFAWGMTIDMQTPDFETRCAILQGKAASQEITLPTAVVEFLATRVPSNIRELEGALNQVLAFCEMRGIEPDLATVTAMFNSGPSGSRRLTSRSIIERCAKHFQVSMEDILGPKRDKDIVVPRQIAMYMLRTELSMRFPKIAHELGRKDHTTAIHSVDKIEKELSYESPIKQYVAELKERLYA
jgi:chromosomal replication initiator protein